MISGVKALGVGLAAALVLGRCRAAGEESSTATARGVIHAFAMPTVAAPVALGIFWNQFLMALGTGNDAAIRSQCTAAGFQSFVRRMDPQKPRGGEWRRLGVAFGKWGPVRWKSLTSVSAYGRLGPAVREHSITLVLTPKGWKLDEWSPD